MTTYTGFTPALALAIREKLDEEGVDPLRIGIGADQGLLDVLVAAINQGIDSHLEAVAFTQTTEVRALGRESPLFLIQAESVPTLVRRLCEPLEAHENTEPDADGQTLADRMRSFAVDVLWLFDIEAEFA